MPRLKCARYETFARKYVTLGNVTEAYRQTRQELKLPPNRNPDSARTRGHAIYHRPEVSRRIGELLDRQERRQMKKGDVTIDASLTEYEEARQMAKLMSKPGEMIAATTAKAKLVGLLRDRVETGNVGDFDGMESVAEILEKVAAERGPAVALELAKLMGLEPVELDENGQTAELLNKAPPTDSVN